MATLNKNPEVSDLVPLTYGKIINSAGNEKRNVFHLKKFVENFKLDVEVDADCIPGYTKDPPQPAFISKSLNESKPEFVYNYPPIGPIPNYFECIICEAVGPDCHEVNCSKPFESSLYLTTRGASKLNKQEGTSYKLIVKKRGQKKVLSTNAKSGSFGNNVILTYENENKTHTVIKVGKNGTINISSGNFKNKSIEKDLVKKINEISDSFVEPDEPFKIDKTESYVYMIFAQFNIFPKENKNNLINLDAIHLNLWETPLFKRKIENRIYFVIKNKKYQIQNYVYNNGSITTKSNKQSNPFIQFVISLEPFKIYTQILKRGAVQLKLTYDDKKYEFKADEPLDLSLLEEVHAFLKNLFTILIKNSSETNYPIIVTEEEKEKKGILNMVDGKQPQVCQNRKGRELRPVPYSFRGTCPIEGYYVNPMGVKRPDGKYEPCCYKIKKTGQDSQDAVYKRWRLGFDNDIPDPDNLSAVFIPGTKIIESRKFKGLNDLTKEQLLDSLEYFGYIGKESPFKKGSIKLIIPFQHFSFINEKTSLEDTLMSSIPMESVRTMIQFDEEGASYFINELKQLADTGLENIEQLKGTVLDGFYDIDDNMYYPFDVLQFKSKDITKEKYKMRFDRLMFILDVLDNFPGSLTFSTNFDESIENITQEKNHFILFVPLNSAYTPGTINKKVKINYIQHPFISLNVENVKGNRWKVNHNGTKISEILLPQKDHTIEIPVMFINSKQVENGDIVLFKLNFNTDGKISYSKPLQPIEKLQAHATDLDYINDMLQFIHNPVDFKELS